MDDTLMRTIANFPDVLTKQVIKLQVIIAKPKIAKTQIQVCYVSVLVHLENFFMDMLQFVDLDASRFDLSRYC